MSWRAEQETNAVQTTSPGPHLIPPQNAATPTHIWDYWAVVMKRLPLVVLVVLASVGLAYFITQKQTKKYRATALVQILPPSVLRSGESAFTPAVVSDEKYLNTQLVI